MRLLYDVLQKKENTLKTPKNAFSRKQYGFHLVNAQFSKAMKE